MSLIIYLAEIKMLIRMRNSPDHDVRFKMETVKDAGEKEWIGVFT